MSQWHLKGLQHLTEPGNSGVQEESSAQPSIGFRGKTAVNRSTSDKLKAIRLLRTSTQS